MFTICTLSRLRKNKSAIATILGMLIFIGVLFTCVIPLFLYVNQMNSIYDQTVLAMRLFDENGEKEHIDLYAYPLSNVSSELNIYIQNRCPLAVDIVRIWINDSHTNYMEKVPAMTGAVIESVNVTLPSEGSEIFNIKLATSRGNVFPSLTNSLYYCGGWSMTAGFTIDVVIVLSKSPSVRQFHINVTGPLGFRQEVDALKRSHETSTFAAISVPTTGEYSVTVTEKGTPIVTDQKVYITLEEPSEWVYVYPT